MSGFCCSCLRKRGRGPAATGGTFVSPAPFLAYSGMHTMGHVRSEGACAHTDTLMRCACTPACIGAWATPPYALCPLHPWYISQRHLHPWPSCSPFWWASRLWAAALGRGQLLLRVHCSGSEPTSCLHARAGCCTFQTCTK